MRGCFIRNLHRDRICAVEVNKSEMKELFLSALVRQPCDRGRAGTSYGRVQHHGIGGRFLRRIAPGPSCMALRSAAEQGGSRVRFLETKLKRGKGAPIT